MRSSSAHHSTPTLAHTHILRAVFLKEEMQLQGRGGFRETCRGEVTFQTCKPCFQGKRGQACLGQECAGDGGRTGAFERFYAVRCVLILVRILTRHEMEAQRLQDEPHIHIQECTMLGVEMSPG